MRDTPRVSRGNWPGCGARKEAMYLRRFLSNPPTAGKSPLISGGLSRKRVSSMRDKLGGCSGEVEREAPKAKKYRRRRLPSRLRPPPSLPSCCRRRLPSCLLSFSPFCVPSRKLSSVCSLLFALFCLLSFVCSLFCSLGLQPPFPPPPPCLLPCLPPPFVLSSSFWFFLKILSCLAANNAGFAKMRMNFHFCAGRIGQKSVREKIQYSYGENGLLAGNILPVVAIIIDFFVRPHSPF